MLLKTAGYMQISSFCLVQLIMMIVMKDVGLDGMIMCLEIFIFVNCKNVGMGDREAQFDAAINVLCSKWKLKIFLLESQTIKLFFLPRRLSRGLRRECLVSLTAEDEFLGKFYIFIEETIPLCFKNLYSMASCVLKTCNVQFLKLTGCFLNGIVEFPKFLSMDCQKLHESLTLDVWDSFSWNFFILRYD
ncbi:hypothetical protein ACH5RR_038199 [Cinchona calisaya]|uniref:Uncharacterized protein n=1 Tax=Cinchona calisaya TaxID=153742 RepID=A0ABD2Y9F8_9GENT